MKSKFLFGMLVLTLVLAACAPQATPTAAPTAKPVTMPTATAAPTEAPTEAPKSIVDIASSDPRFSTLVAAVQAAGLVDTLKGDGPFTVFAPTNDAFAALPAGTVENLLKPENKQQLTDILLYHVVPGKVMAADVAALDGKMVDTALKGKQIAIKTDMGNVTLNDKVKVIATDIEASNGVIHVIDSVLLPPVDEAASPAAQKDIVDTAVADGRFKTLVAAVTAAGLVETLKGEGPFTVFAPTDDAFAALPAGTIESLLKPENKQKLADILLYHVVPGKVMAADVTGLTKATTALGKDINIKVEDGKVILNDKVQVIMTDIETSNGVIHVIDGVLLPPQ
ncbi:MAG: fasciclin domain-containing protein [Bacteroidota bacterium]